MLYAGEYGSMIKVIYTFGMAILTGLGIGGLSALAQESTTPPPTETATVILMDAAGAQIGTVVFITQEDKVLVTALIENENMPAGFHGFHLHSVGSCEDSGQGAFSAAGEHFNPTGAAHDDHAGDFPTLLINEDGSGYISFVTDRFTIADMFDDDGSAVIIHSNADNHAHIPERYGQPDEETLSSGDSGERIACGVLEMGASMFEPGPNTGTAEPTAAG
jgi:superoxide dismutase, Cu-Zn family